MKREPERIILITGTASGIGRFLTEYYTGMGDQVIGCDIHESDFHHEHYRHFILDVTDEKGVKSMYGEIRKTFGRLDVLINNAGIASMNLALLTTVETFHRVMNTNVIGTFLCSREAAKIMKQHQFGRIVNFVSIATPLKLKGESSYASSKAAISSMTEILAHEFAEMGITVNAIGPNPIRTNLLRSVPEETIQKLIDQQAVHRYGTYEDIVNVIDFFLKPESDLITAQIIYLGGIS